MDALKKQTVENRIAELEKILSLENREASNRLAEVRKRHSEIRLGLEARLTAALSALRLCRDAISGAMVLVEEFAKTKDNPEAFLDNNDNVMRMKNAMRDADAILTK